MPEIDLLAHADLRSAQSPWQRLAQDQRDGRVAADMACDVLIVGGGITGALLAEHLTARGRAVVVIDRERPGLGSTAASTSMLQWEIDAPLSELTDYYGFDHAADIYQRSLRAVSGLKELARTLEIPCDFRDRSTLYLAGGDTGAGALRAEFDLRMRAGLPGAFLDHATLLRAFGIDKEAAIYSPGSADADPLRLAQGLLNVAKGRGARVLEGEAIAYDHGATSVGVSLAHGVLIEAKHVVLATGYDIPDFIPSDIHAVASSWAIATVPQQPGTLWPEEALIWDASDSYVYARTTHDGRIVFGGEDSESVVEPTDRDAAIAAKSVILQGKLRDLWPRANVTIESRWAGAFGETLDGLPLIGAVPGAPRIFAAYGYGGNGITFSYIASRIIGRLISGVRSSWFEHFALDRSAPTGAA